MKLVFASATAALVFAAAPSHAASILSAGVSQAGSCAEAAAASARTAMPDRRLYRAIAGCTAALKGDISQVTRAATLVNRGILEAAAKRNTDAIADYTVALSLDGSLSQAYLNRGSLYLAEGRYAEARADLDRAVAMNVPNLHVAYFNRAGAEEASGNIMAAYGDYLRAQAIAPDFKPAQEELERFHVERRVASRG